MNLLLILEITIHRKPKSLEQHSKVLLNFQIGYWILKLKVEKNLLRKEPQKKIKFLPAIEVVIIDQTFQRE